MNAREEPRGTILFCNRCGAYATQQRQALNSACKAAGAGSGLIRQLRKLRSLNYPNGHERYRGWTIRRVRAITEQQGQWAAQSSAPVPSSNQLIEEQLFDRVGKERWRWHDKPVVLKHFGLDHQAFVDLTAATLRKARRLDAEDHAQQEGFRWWDDECD